MSNIAIFGAGGKMGCRLIDNLSKHNHRLLLVEVSDAGLANIAQRGLAATPQAEAVAAADVVILALPDRLMSGIAHAIVPQLKSGAMVITLDPAVAHAGGLPARDDISYFVTHPCHPGLFEHLETKEEREDIFGGVHARQAIVCALMQGPESDYALGEGLARQFLGPVSRSHRITVPQMAILEPAMAETCGLALVLALREVMEEAIRRGVPRAAAEDFMYGHLKVELEVGFGRVGIAISDGAKLIAQYGRRRLLRDDWLKVFEPDSVQDQVQTILRHDLSSLEDH